jgi:hypothetical protein
MALTGTFEADFSSFYSAVQQATVELRSFETGANKVETSLERMANKFSGQKVIQDAQLMTEAIAQLGGASTLTEAELARVGRVASEAVEKMRAIGMDVPKGMQDLAAATKGAGDQTESLGAKVLTLAGSYITAEAAIHLVESAYEGLVSSAAAVIDAASKSEEAQAGLLAALEAQGTAVPSVVSAYDDYAKALQETTRYSADAVKAAEGVLVQIGGVMPRDMEKALQATTNLAAGLRIDLSQAAMMVAKAAEGETTALKKAGVVLDESKGGAADFGTVLDQLNTKFAGAAEAAGSTFAGGLAKLGNAWDDVLAATGRVITSNATWAAAVDGLTGIIQSNTTELNGNATANDLVSDAIILVAKAAGLAVDAFDLVNQGIQGARMIWDGFNATILNVGITLAELGKMVNDVNATLPGFLGAQARENVRQYDAYLETLHGRFDKLAQDFKAAQETSGAWSGALQGFKGQIDDLVGKLEATRGATVGVTKAQEDGLDAWGRNTENVKAQAEAATKAAAAAKIQSDALAVLASVSGDFHATVAALNPQLVDLVKGYLSAGVAADTLAKASGLTAAQIAAVSKVMQEEIQLAKQADAVQAEHAKLVAQYWKLAGSMSHDSVAAQIKDVIAWGDAQAAAMEKAKTNTAQTYADLQRIVATSIDAIILKTEELDPSTKASAQKTADEALHAYQFALGHMDQYTAESLVKLQDASDAAGLALAEWGAAAQESVGAVAAGANTASSALGGMTGQLNAATSAAHGLTQAIGVLDAGHTVALTSGAIEDQMTGKTTTTGWVIPGTMINPDRPSQGYGGTYGSPGWAPGSGFIPNPGANIPTPGWPGRAAGGPVAAGQAYMVGERGPELFVPPSNGTILPHGAAAPSIVIQAGAFSFVYPIMDNPQAMDHLARTVGAAILAKATRAGARV